MSFFGIFSIKRSNTARRNGEGGEPAGMGSVQTKKNGRPLDDRPVDPVSKGKPKERGKDPVIPSG